MAYGSVAAWQLFADERGQPLPDDNPPGRAALARASDYIRRTYVLPYALDPHHELVEEATYIAAQFELESPGFFGKAYTPKDRKVLTEAKGIKWSVLPGASANDPRPTIPAINDMLLSIRRRSKKLDSIWVV